MVIFEIWQSKKGGNTDKIRQVLQVLMNSLPDSENIDFQILEHKINSLCKSIANFWKKVNRSKFKILNKYSDWLSVVENVVLLRSDKQKVDAGDQPSHSRGRPRKDFLECSSRSKRRRLADLSNADKSTVSALLNSSSSSNFGFSKTDTNEVLSLLIEANLTKHQYLLIKKFIDSKVSFNIFPSYHSIVSAKKNCYPSNITITESSAEIELQNLLDHTVTRIMESQKDVLSRVSNDSLDSLTLIGKWGFDGSTGHSEYKQNFSDSSLEDGSLFVTSYVPLQLIMNPGKSAESNILWKNPRPASTRYCRPIRFQFLKESSTVSIEEERYFKEKISNLQHTVYKSNDKEYKIKHSLQLTMVDGKVCSALSETSSCRCYLCGATPREMNKIDDCLNREVSENRFEFGLSPLHSWIRFFEYFIHLSYRLDIKKWQVRSKEEKELLSTKKMYIQAQFREKMGLVIDKPRSGGSGTSNDGNTARKFFKNSTVSAQITNINKNLIDRCCTILSCLSSGYNINKTKFKEFALQTARQLVHEYPWYNLPASVHKVLIHGSEVIDHALLSIGELSEEAAESTNKNIKAFRQNHTRKMSRIVTNTDLLNRLLLNSDPLVTDLRKLPAKKMTSLSKDVVDLLCV